MLQSTLLAARPRRPIGRLAAFALVALLAGPTWAAPARPAAGSSSLVINEIDYVQRTVDRAEFVELLNVGEVPVDLGRHRLWGIDRNGEAYRTFELLDHWLQPGEHFVVCGQLGTVPGCDQAVALRAGIWQDGASAEAPNAVALLLDPTGKPEDYVLIDSVGYEGEVPGEAPDGRPWTEGRGVDPGDDPDRDHLGISRLPEGRDTDDNAADFAPRCITPGAPNSELESDCAAPEASPGLVINEIDYLQLGQGDVAEFVEVYNAGDRALDLGRYDLLGVDNAGKEYLRVSLPTHRLDPGGYFVLCGLTDQVPNCDLAVMEPSVDVWKDFNTFEGPAAVALVKAGRLPALDLLVDSVSHDGDVPGGTGTGGSWTEEAGVSPGDTTDQQHMGLSRLPDGADTNVNADDFGLRCITPGHANTSASEKCLAAEPVRGLVINEVDYVQPGSPDEAEFVELRNIGRRVLDLGQYVLVGVDANGRVYGQPIPLPRRPLAPGAYFVVCSPADPAPRVPNCDLPAGPTSDAWQDTYSSQSPYNVVALLRDLDPTLPGDNILVDSLAYDGFVEGGPATGRGWTEGDGVSPGDEPELEHLSLSRLPDGVDTDNGPADFGQGCSTPGYENQTRPPTGGCQPAQPFTPTPTATDRPGATPSPTATDRPTLTTTPATPSATPTDGPPGRTVTPSPTATSGRPGSLERITVDDPGDASDPDPSDGACQTPRGGCTLRAAIETANADPGSQSIRIVFDAPGRIELSAARLLPAIERAGVTIDGRSGGAVVARGRSTDRLQSPQQLDCAPGQQLRGMGRGSGLHLIGSGQAVQGMAISGFEHGVELGDGAAGARIGSDGDGSADAAECNAIWDNRTAQIRIAGASGNRVAGNLIGVAPDGSASLLSRSAVGVDIAEGASGNLVGVGLTRTGDPAGLGNRIQNSAVGIRVGGDGSADNRIMGNAIGAGDRSTWEAQANGIGIQLAAGATGAWIGGPPDWTQDVPAELANQIAFNLAAGIQVDRAASGNSIRANVIHHNRRDGIRLAQTRSGANTLLGNRIMANGGAAIAVEPEGPQLPPPSIDWLSPDGSQIGGSTCPGCLVEVFADEADEAGYPLGRYGRGAADGSWSLSGLDLLVLPYPRLTAIATDAEGNSSRLGPQACTAQWRLVAIPPREPRALRRRERVIERAFRLLNDRGERVAGAEIVFSPLDLRFPSDDQGVVRLEIPFELALSGELRRSNLTVEAVDRGGASHCLSWYPPFVVARAEPAPLPGGTLLDLGGLGPDGIGGLLRRLPGGTVASRLVERAPLSGLWPAASTAAEALSGRRPPLAPAQDEADPYGAAFAAAPTSELREGQYAWQENLARGGGIYELHAAEGSTLSGELEIIAPVTAYDAGRPASACSADPEGAVIAGWNQDQGCWIPMPGVTVDAPPGGSSTFRARGAVQIEPSGFALLGQLQASTAITLYTVGFDTSAPALDPSLGEGDRVSSLPAVLARVEEALSGVRARDGVTATLGGLMLPVSYDVESGEIRLAPEDRALPDGLTGSVPLVIEVEDGFCNRAAVTITVRVDPDAPPPDDGRTLYIPRLFQNR